MILLDAYAVIGLLCDEATAEEVATLLRNEQCAMTSVNLIESLDVSVRVHKRDPQVVRMSLLKLRASVLGLVDLGEAEAVEAARLRWTYYHGRKSALSLADCALVASARLHGASVATSDPPLAAAARHQSVPVIALPDSNGNRP